MLTEFNAPSPMVGSNAPAIRYRSTSTLLSAVKIARRDPQHWFNVPGWFPIQGSEVLRNFADGVMRRCNRGLELGNEARYQDLLHDARIINDSKRRIRWSGRNLLNDARLAKRYPHVHNPPQLE